MGFVKVTSVPSPVRINSTKAQKNAKIREIEEKISKWEAKLKK